MQVLFLFLIYLVGGLLWGYCMLVCQIVFVCWVWGLQYLGLDFDLFMFVSFVGMVQDYVQCIVVLVLVGLVYLVGWLVGGIFVQEVVVCLSCMGYVVGIVVMLDSYFVDVWCNEFEFDFVVVLCVLLVIVGYDFEVYCDLDSCVKVVVFLCQGDSVLGVLLQWVLDGVVCVVMEMNCLICGYYYSFYFGLVLYFCVVNDYKDRDLMFVMWMFYVWMIEVIDLLLIYVEMILGKVLVLIVLLLVSCLVEG